MWQADERVGAGVPLRGPEQPAFRTDMGRSQALLQDHRSVARPLIRMLGEPAVRRGLLTEAQRDCACAGLAEAAERGALHMSVTMFGVVAHRTG